MKTIYLTTIILSALLLYNGCDTTEPPPTPPQPEIKDTVTINVTQTTHRSITLNVQTTAHHQNRTVELYRSLNQNDTLTASFPLTVKDTTIIDDNNGEGLTIDTEYGYFAVTLDSTNTPQDTTEKTTAKTLSPTSHDYDWEEFTIGEWQSSLSDVWGTDENNVYAVGGVKINDTTYGVIKWNGSEWVPHKKVGGVNAIHGFSNTDIWAVGGAVEHWDGNSWTRIDATVNDGHVTVVDSVLFYEEPYTSLWGTSSENLYLGNNDGKIIHWDGEEGEVEDVKTQRSIKDIWGTDKDRIFAVSGSFYGESELLFYNGSFWKTIAKGEVNPVDDQLQSPFLTVWGHSNIVYFGGPILYSFVDNELHVEGRIGKNNVYGISGTLPNNIFAVGTRKSISHYNGIDWHTYENHMTMGINLEGVCVFQNTAFAVGWDGSIAKIVILRKNKS